MVELKQKFITSLSKVADRDTYHIAVEDLEKTIESLSAETLSIILNSLYDSCNDSKPAAVKESIRLLSFICYSHADLTPIHLTKIITHIVKRLKDADSGVRDACHDAIGALLGQYMKDERYSGSGSVVALFLKPLFEAMAEQDIGVQSGAAMCMAKMVDCATKPSISAGEIITVTMEVRRLSTWPDELLASLVEDTGVRHIKEQIGVPWREKREKKKERERREKETGMIDLGKRSKILA